MAPALAASGSTALTANTETFVWSLTAGTAGTFFLEVDGTNLTSGALLTVRSYKMVVAAGNRLVAEMARPVIGILNADGERYWRTEPYTNVLGADATGTLRFSLTCSAALTIPWAVIEL